MKLYADLASDLDWKVDVKDPVLWELDFDFQFSEAALRSYILAVEQFVEVWKKYSGLGVVLYRGSLDIIKKIPADNEIEAATLFGEFLHRLASFLPDDANPQCLFEGPHSFSKGRAIQLMSKERFQHISLGEISSPKGLLLPPDELCSQEVLKTLELNLQTRVIPEKMLNEMWDGLDHLVVVEDALTQQGLRHLQGFEAAGGTVQKVRSRGIRTPDPLLPKQLR